MPISVVINTRDSAPYLPRALDSVKGFDEILVCDLGSSDDTVDVARAAGCTILEFPVEKYTGPEPARNFSIRHARNKWVLILEPQEMVPVGLLEYLEEMADAADDMCGLYIPRRSFVMYRESKNLYPDYSLRFFRRDSVNWPLMPGARPIVSGRVHKIAASQRHLAILRPTLPMQIRLRRINMETEAEVDKMQVRKISFMQLMGATVGEFMKSYFLLGSWRYGLSGYIQAANMSIYRFLVLSKLHERHALMQCLVEDSRSADTRSSEVRVEVEPEIKPEK